MFFRVEINMRNVCLLAQLTTGSQSADPYSCVLLYPDREEATSLQLPGLRLKDVRQPVSHSRAGAGFVVSAGQSVSCAWEAFQKSINHALLAHLLFCCPFPKSLPCDFQENLTPVPSVPAFPNTRCSEANRFSCSAFPSKFCPGYPTPLPCQQVSPQSVLYEMLLHF